MRIKINDYIVVDSEICGGTPTFKGTRVMVWQVLELLGAGISIDEILRDYFPSLTKPTIFSVMTYASKLIGEEKYVLLQG
ncbi:MAG: DUF433 domain-containing protein [Nanoarchaeota archaeon]|nr:DUF433 domain-containing protein [Nanoarchaeota archaeon]